MRARVKYCRRPPLSPCPLTALHRPPLVPAPRSPCLCACALHVRPVPAALPVRLCLHHRASARLAACLWLQGGALRACRCRLHAARPRPQWVFTLTGTPPPKVLLNTPNPLGNDPATQAAEAARGQQPHLALTAASISAAVLPLAQMMKMWPNFASYPAFQSASSCVCKRGSATEGGSVGRWRRVVCDGSDAAGRGQGSFNKQPQPNPFTGAHASHLQHCVSRARRCRLLAAAHVAECAAILLPQPLHVADARVGGKGFQPARHWCLHRAGEYTGAGVMPGRAAPGTASGPVAAAALPAAALTRCHHASRAASISSSRPL